MKREPHLTNACVLLSGGMDSVSVLHWARDRYQTVRAIGFRYGQPHQDAELVAAGDVATRLQVPFSVVVLADALNPRLGFLAGVADHDASKVGGLNAAFVPGRNILFLTVAAAHACGWFHGNIDLVMGACAADAQGFPDCRPSVLAQLGFVLRAACAREIQVVTPFVDRTKEQILRSLTAAGLEDVRRSWSCYRGLRTGPCGACTACVARATAFAAVGVADLSAFPMMFGGDPSREVPA